MTSLIADKAQAALKSYATGNIAPLQALVADAPLIVMHANAGKPGYVSAWFNCIASHNITGKSEQVDVYMPLLGIDSVAAAQRTIDAKYPGAYVVVSAQMQGDRPF